MTRPVSENPPLPYPSKASQLQDLAGFDADLVRALFSYLGELARVANSGLSADGSDLVTGDIDFNGFSILNLLNLTATGTLTAAMARLTSTTDASLSSTGHAFQIGPTAGPNLIADPNEIMARDNGAVSSLNLQADGGQLIIGSGTGADVHIGPNTQITIHGAVGNAGIEIGRHDGVASTPYIDFHSGVTAIDYDVRMIASGGDGTPGHGSLVIEASPLTLTFGQIAFPATQNPSSSANVLDDYEEGDYTPSVTATSGTFTSVAATGHYIKVGRQVTVGISVTITTNGTAGGAIVASLPFAVPSGAGTFGFVGAGRENTSTGHELSFSTSPGTSTGFLVKYDNTYPGADGRNLTFTVVYFTAS